MTRRIAVLLGAGASLDAGLPLTRGLAERIVRRANDESHTQSESWLRALNFVYASMVDHGSRHGDNPLGAVDFERLMSALRLLKGRDDHEATPFVASWKAGSEGFAESRHAVQSWEFQRALNKAILGGPFAADDLLRLTQQIARTADHGQANGSAFEQAEHQVMRLVERELSTFGDTEYLAPLADLARRQEGGLAVCTLNYDRTVEEMARAQDVPVCRGFENEWQIGTKLRWCNDRGHLDLIKVHGSLDWHAPVNRGYWATEQRLKIRVSTGESNRGTRPWIVLGDREKLATAGPTLSLLRAAEDALEFADHVAVVGYSFSDAHINSILETWMIQDASHSLAVVDPFFAKSKNSFVELLKTDFPLRIYPFEAAAKDCLAAAMEAFPDGPPASWFGVTTRMVDGHAAAEIELLGPAFTLRDVVITQPDAETPIQLWPTSSQPPAAQEDDAMRRGDHRTFVIPRNVRADELTIQVSGQALPFSYAPVEEQHRILVGT